MISARKDRVNLVGFQGFVIPHNIKIITDFVVLFPGMIYIKGFMLAQKNTLLRSIQQGTKSCHKKFLSTLKYFGNSLQDIESEIHALVSLQWTVL